MNTTITPELLTQTGVSIPAEQVGTLVEQLNAELEERVGEEITNALDDDKLETLAKLQETATDEELAEWINMNIEDLEAIINDEIDILLGEVSENVEKFNQTS